MSEEIKKSSASDILAEQNATTRPTVVAGLGYPNGRDSNSPEPTGWQTNTAEVTFIKKQVSRETSR